MSVKGFMLFKAEFAENEFHPDNAPQEELPAFNAEGFAESYCLYSTLEEANAAADEDHAMVIDAVASGDMEDAEEKAYALPVSVDADGTVTVYSAEGMHQVRQLSMEEMYQGFFGMEPPKLAEPDPEP
ncbi:hypothetical protein ACGYLO_12280 [Sulfitobacter sp. 1A13353]|uniref:hypothetical protein n=1 Tax=Sulfitobacter sp. 1A13353 TaxID=3368568 RepID=UPI00374664AF